MKRRGSLAGPLHLFRRTIHSGNRHLWKTLSQSARVKSRPAAKFDQSCSPSRTVIWPNSCDNPFGVITKQMFATERISPRGMLEKTVMFKSMIFMSPWNSCCFVEKKLFWRHLKRFPLAHSVLVLVFSVKSFPQLVMNWMEISSG